jgi:hypothetical protein
MSWLGTVGMGAAGFGKGARVTLARGAAAGRNSALRMWAAYGPIVDGRVP